MFDGGVKANHTDPLLEHPLGSLGSQVAWVVSSMVENGRLLMTLALAKSSLAGCASAAGAGSITNASPIVAVNMRRIKRRVLDTVTSASAGRAGRLIATTPLCVGTHQPVNMRPYLRCPPVSISGRRWGT